MSQWYKDTHINLGSVLLSPCKMDKIEWVCKYLCEFACLATVSFRISGKNPENNMEINKIHLIHLWPTRHTNIQTSTLLGHHYFNQCGTEHGQQDLLKRYVWIFLHWVGVFINPIFLNYDRPYNSNK